MGQEDNTSFYCIFPIEDENGVDGYFLSHNKWEELKTKLNPETDELQNFNPDDDTDLSERKKGL